MKNSDFQKLLQRKGTELWRDMPWREDTRSYYVLVSELMLQQTQVGRVIPKFEAFIEEFPDEKALAAASLGEVLKLWQGLGYNRRAKYLHDAARKIVQDFGGEFPRDETDILSLPGIGKNTAGAIRVYAFNQPAVFVETNVRTVYIHHFFADDFDVTDKQIIEKMYKTVPWSGKGKEQPDEAIHSLPGAMRKTVGLSYGPRRFYQNLMDYGSWLKANGVRNNARSKQYKKQSPLRGSLREMRGEILRRLTRGDANWRDEIEHDVRFDEALAGLEHDGLLAEYLTK